MTNILPHQRTLNDCIATMRSITETATSDLQADMTQLAPCVAEVANSLNQHLAQHFTALSDAHFVTVAPLARLLLADTVSRRSGKRRRRALKRLHAFDASLTQAHQRIAARRKKL